MKKVQLQNQNLIELDTKNFIDFMKNPTAVSRIVQEHSQIIKNLKTDDFKTQKTKKVSGRVKLLDIFRGFGKTIASIISDATKFLCMIYPTSDRLYEFWTMILKTNCHVIVLLAANGEINNQCWTTDAAVECEEIRIKAVQIVVMDCYTKTTLELKQDGKVKEVVHLHYTKWPSDNLSHCPSQLISFISIVNKVSAENKTDQDVPSRPIVIQCNDSAKSGVFCLLDMCISEFKKNKVVSVPKALLKMRQIYGNSISQPENYVFCYNAMYQFVTKCKE